MSKPGKRRPRTAQRPGDSADEAKDFRALCNALKFWRVCGKPPCRRALGCRGDAQACFRQFWRQMPEHARVWVRAAIRASAGGLGKAAVRQAADEELARWQAIQERYAPKPAPVTQHDVTMSKPAASPAGRPRIRTL